MLLHCLGSLQLCPVPASRCSLHSSTSRLPEISNSFSATFTTVSHQHAGLLHKLRTLSPRAPPGFRFRNILRRGCTSPSSSFTSCSTPPALFRLHHHVTKPSRPIHRSSCAPESQEHSLRRLRQLLLALQRPTSRHVRNFTSSPAHVSSVGAELAKHCRGSRHFQWVQTTVGTGSARLGESLWYFQLYFTSSNACQLECTSGELCKTVSCDCHGMPISLTSFCCLLKTDTVTHPSEHSNHK